ncbi:MAG TPA: hypothetical protein VF511_02140, partial [Chthoniobacterales bacterium]
MLAGTAQLAPPVITKGGAEVELPSHLDFEENVETALDFFARLENALFRRRVKRITVNHRPLQSITPDAAMVLNAEMYRAHHFDPHKDKPCYLPTDPTVCTILDGIGYFRHFSGAKT